MSAPMSVVAVDGGELPLGGGLLALLRPALALLPPGGQLALSSSAPSVAQDLPAWCRVERHDYLGADPLPEGRTSHRIARGSLGVARAPEDGGLALPERADPATGFAPRGAAVEPGGPVYPFTLVERDHVIPPEVGMLYEQAVSSQWVAARDIPWDTVKPLPPALEQALGQTMTFLAENELSALYVPATFLPRIHPAYAEVAMFLATQLHDESRHIEVFLRRARAGGGRLGVSSVTTSQSLLSLLELNDFTEAAFLLSVLGEGTFLDLLKFVERFAPDEATLLLTQKARVDETRHVHFGLAHVRHALGHDPSLYGRLEAAVRKRAATMASAAGVPAPLADALTILAAGGGDPRGVRKGHEAFRELLETMHENRIRRLEHAGFSPEQAKMLSDLHTPNFM
ncbi:MAG TPA: ferritin-like domain-containing protein [Planctomycetota bacterium]|nr:ferritin-like domain-containing protein [Planctomycetota bacterium]